MKKGVCCYKEYYSLELLLRKKKEKKNEVMVLYSMDGWMDGWMEQASGVFLSSEEPCVL